jgi:hypothetical protein
MADHQEPWPGFVASIDLWLRGTCSRGRYHFNLSLFLVILIILEFFVVNIRTYFLFVTQTQRRISFGSSRSP